MPTVSDNFSSRFVKLDDSVSCEYVCQQVSLLINNFTQNNKDVKECLLTLDIKPISYSVDPTVPRIEETVSPNTLDSP